MLPRMFAYRNHGGYSRFGGRLEPDDWGVTVNSCSTLLQAGAIGRNFLAIRVAALHSAGARRNTWPKSLMHTYTSMSHRPRAELRSNTSTWPAGIGTTDQTQPPRSETERAT